MATSLDFNPQVKFLLPNEILDRLRVIPMGIRLDRHGPKLALIARKPLTQDALLELKALTGIDDYELQIVGEDVLDVYLPKFKDGTLFHI